MPRNTNRILFHQMADKRLDEIWQYTQKAWGTSQANEYIRNMYAVYTLHNLF